MKRGKKLWIMLLALVILCGLSVVVTRINPENQEEEETEAAETVELTLDIEAVTGISWTYDETSLKFSFADEAWTYDDDAVFPVDSAVLEPILEAITGISAQEVLEAAEDPGEYGLDEPACTIVINTGEETEIKIGDESGMGGQRYLSNGDGKVYLVDEDLLDEFDLELYDFLKEESIPAMSDVLELKIEAETLNQEIVYLEDSGLTYSDSYVWFMKGENEAGEDGYLVLDTELTEEMITALTGLSWSECVNYNADAAALAEYGLDAPTAVVEITYLETVQVETSKKDDDGNVIYEEQTSEKTFTLEIGTYDDSDCYARLSGSNMVYLIDGEISDYALYSDYEALRPDDVLKMDMETVDSVEITVAGTTYTVVKETQTETDDEGNTTTTVTYTLDGNEIEIGTLLEGISGMTSTGSAIGATPERSEEIRIVFNRNTEAFAEVELVFYQYDSSSCLTTLDGETTRFVSRDDVVTLVDEIEQAILESQEPETAEAMTDPAESGSGTAK